MWENNPAHRERLLVPSDAPEDRKAPGRVKLARPAWLALLDLLDSLFLFLDNAFRQRSVRESGCHLLPVRRHPV
jgi:hypothetical protein